MSEELTIGQAAKGGVNVQTVRYYERLGLLRPTSRRPSGYRIYGTEEVQQLQFIKNAQALGFTLREVTELLSTTCTASRRDVERKAKTKLEQLEGKARALNALARSLRTLIRQCRQSDGTEDGCPIIERLRQPRRNRHDDANTTG